MSNATVSNSSKKRVKCRYKTVEYTTFVFLANTRGLREQKVRNESETGKRHRRGDPMVSALDSGSKVGVQALAELCSWRGHFTLTVVSPHAGV